MQDISESPGSYSSRKFILTIIALVLITGMSALGIWFITVSSVMPTFVGGILGVLSLYFAGNIANKFVVGKNTVEMERVVKEDQGEDE